MVEIVLWSIPKHGMTVCGLVLRGFQNQRIHTVVAKICSRGSTAGKRVRGKLRGKLREMARVVPFLVDRVEEKKAQISAP